MATITLYKEKVNGVGGLIDNLIKSSSNLDVQLGTLKNTLQGVDSSTCNLQDTFNMVLDEQQSVREPGGFALKEDIPNVDFARNDMAIKGSWKTDCGKVATYRIRPGVELNVRQGPIGPQIDLEANKYLPGNSNLTQYELFKGLTGNRMDYIEFVSLKRIK